MTLLNLLLYKLSAYLRCRKINGPDNIPYLERYHLFGLPFGYRVYIHRFVASDPGRGLHNHPWSRALSIVLSGSYEEVRMDNVRYDFALRHRKLAAGSLNWIDGSVFHRINLNPNSQCWTLFIHSQKEKSWGFLQSRDHQYSFHDHNQILPHDSNPLWWKTAPRPINQPQMRQPLITSADTFLVDVESS